MADQFLDATQFGDEVVHPINVLDFHGGGPCRKWRPLSLAMAHAPMQAGSPITPMREPKRIVGRRAVSCRGHAGNASCVGSPVRVNAIQARRIVVDNAAICVVSPPASIGASCHAANVPNTNGKSMQWQALKGDAAGAQSNR